MTALLHKHWNTWGAKSFLTLVLGGLITLIGNGVLSAIDSRNDLRYWKIEDHEAFDASTQVHIQAVRTEVIGLQQEFRSHRQEYREDQKEIQGDIKAILRRTRE